MPSTHEERFLRSAFTPKSAFGKGYSETLKRLRSRFDRTNFLLSSVPHPEDLKRLKKEFSDELSSREVKNNVLLHNMTFSGDAPLGTILVFYNKQFSRYKFLVKKATEWGVSAPTFKEFRKHLPVMRGEKQFIVPFENFEETNRNKSTQVAIASYDGYLNFISHIVNTTCLREIIHHYGLGIAESSIRSLAARVEREKVGNVENYLALLHIHEFVPVEQKIEGDKSLFLTPEEKKSIFTRIDTTMPSWREKLDDELSRCHNRKLDDLVKDWGVKGSKVRDKIGAQGLSGKQKAAFTFELVNKLRHGVFGNKQQLFAYLDSLSTRPKPAFAERKEFEISRAGTEMVKKLSGNSEDERLLSRFEQSFDRLVIKEIERKTDAFLLNRRLNREEILKNLSSDYERDLLLDEVYSSCKGARSLNRRFLENALEKNINSWLVREASRPFYEPSRKVPQRTFYQLVEKRSTGAQQPPRVSLSVRPLVKKSLPDKVQRVYEHLWNTYGNKIGNQSILLNLLTDFHKENPAAGEYAWRLIQTKAAERYDQEEFTGYDLAPITAAIAAAEKAMARRRLGLLSK